MGASASLIAQGTARGIIALFWITCIGVPIFALFNGASSMPDVIHAFNDPVLWSVAGFTIIQALASVFISVAIGLPLGLIATQSRTAGFLLSLPYSVPTVAAGMAFSLRLAYSAESVVIAHVFLNAPWVALVCADSVLRVNPARIETARALGASSWNRFWFVIWPEVRFPLASAAAHVFSLCSTSFALVLLLGGGPPVETLETRIFSKIRSGASDFDGAIACAIVELAIATLPWVLALFLEPRMLEFQARPLPLRRAPPRRWINTLAIMVASFFCAPFIFVFIDALKGSWSIGSESARSLAVSLTLASLGALLSVALALLSAIAIHRLRVGQRRFLLMALSMPAGISTIVLGLGAWIAYDRFIDPFEGSFSLLLVIQTTVAFPFALRAILPLSQTMPARALECARTLGASPMQAFWHVDWPRWRPVVLATSAMVAGSVFGEVSAASLFANENFIPLPVLVSRLTNQYRFGEAQVVTALLIGVAWLGALAAFHQREAA